MKLWNLDNGLDRDRPRAADVEHRRRHARAEPVLQSVLLDQRRLC